MKSICFFSSDARPLYKRDVFRAMSYPKGFVLHFRYDPRHIQGDASVMQGKKGIIFLSTSNDLNIPVEDRIVANISIREVIIKTVEHTSDTNRTHFYLELGDFKDYQLGNNSPDILPPNKWVAELEVHSDKTIDWQALVDKIKHSFTKQLFYKFEILSDKQKIIAPLYNEIEKQSFYKLRDETGYLLQIAFCDTEPGNSNEYHSLKVSSQSDKVKVVAPEMIDIEARRDNRIYTLFTQTISSSNAFGYLNFETIVKSIILTNQQSKPVTDTTLKIELEKNSRRSNAFALNSILAAVSVGYAKVLSDKVDVNGNFSLSLTIQFILAAILGYYAAFNLYKLFDKK